ncbi:CST complex subunit Ten1 [Podospora aff. communis PSN243]|uniref:CST complex subunit Ten1 n=1 Tax=Podospora aff. communis PSN243 TaxID=3040156 RepID=A0AAV9GKU6_9PEZI|nr:CST complex subunit Ten1 [Podospora aff. communis PSN243]
MANGPPPSTLCLLSELPSREVREKVRFLGCVTSYSTASATLRLEHQYPADRPSVCALVNVDLVLERLGQQQTRIGEWVNVIGYITSIHPSTDRRKPQGHGDPMVRVQALIIWSAGSLDVQRYETSVDDLRPKKPSIGGDKLPSDTI